jgi:hypothetical protein
MRNCGCKIQRRQQLRCCQVTQWGSLNEFVRLEGWGLWGEVREVRVKFGPVWALDVLVCRFVMTWPFSELTLGHGRSSIRGIGIRGRIGGRESRTEKCTSEGGIESGKFRRFLMAGYCMSLVYGAFFVSIFARWRSVLWILFLRGNFLQTKHHAVNVHGTPCCQRSWHAGRFLAFLFLLNSLNESMPITQQPSAFMKCGMNERMRRQQYSVTNSFANLHTSVTMSWTFVLTGMSNIWIGRVCVSGNFLAPTMIILHFSVIWQTDRRDHFFTTWTTEDGLPDEFFRRSDRQVCNFEWFCDRFFQERMLNSKTGMVESRASFVASKHAL